MEKEFISVIVPVYNEERYIAECIHSMLEQDYPQDRMEWVFVDGASTDRTLEILREYERKYPALISVMENVHKTVPYAMNMAIKATTGKYIIRLDAHAEYPNDYFSKCIEVLEETGADNVGGYFETTSRTEIGATIAKMLSSSFGVGDAKFRLANKDGYVDTVPFGTFRREIFDRVGLFDERLTRNQDSELNARIIRGGGKIYLSSKIRLAYYCRDSVWGILKMAMLNGKWNIITSRLCPGSMRLRHFVPCFFVLSLLLLPLLGLLWRGFWALLGLELALYLTLDVICSVRLADGFKEFCRLMYLFPAFHIFYGFGSLRGITAVLLGQEGTREKSELSALTDGRN